MVQTAKVPFPQFVLNHGRDHSHYKSSLVVEDVPNITKHY